MITAPAYQDKKVGVFGLARTGVAAVKALTASGAKVYAWDDNDERRASVQPVAADLYELDFSELDALLLAPGVPLTHPKPHRLVEKATASETPLISDIDVFEAARVTLPSHQTVGITGTNGKSTTTALVGHIFEVCGRPVAVGGNIGTGVLALSALAADGVYIFELSSFQLDLTQSFSADVAVLLNVSPDHLDRHGSFANYAAAKKRLFDLQGETGIAIVGVDDTFGQNLLNHLETEAIAVSVKRELEDGIYVQNGVLFDALSDELIEVGDLTTAKCLQGEHNWQNAAAAYAVGRKSGLKPQRIFDAIVTFPGLVHRQELVAEIAGVRFINDSKATNSDAAARALQSFDHIHWIAGGRAKESSFAHLGGAASHVKKAYFIGEAAEQLVQDLGNVMVCEKYADLTTALDAAGKNTEPGDTVLLSPACTAFDQFPDFEKRGDAFRDRVLSMGGGEL